MGWTRSILVLLLLITPLLVAFIVWKDFLAVEASCDSWRLQEFNSSTTVDEQTQPHKDCFFRFSISNEGIGGMINQIMVGKVLGAMKELRFCLNGTLDDPNETHPNQYYWLLNYWHIEFCKDHPPNDACDVYAMWMHQYWNEPYVYRLYRRFYKSEYAKMQQEMILSAKTKNYTYCVHVRTGDAVSVPASVPWTGKKTFIFGSEKKSYPFCQNNECIFLPKTTDVEEDFINMVNCRHLVPADSSFSVTAKLLSPYNTEYVKMARISNTLFTA